MYHRRRGLVMKKSGWWLTALVLAGASSVGSAQGSASGTVGSGAIQHVLLLSIDGMHAVDYYNCSRGVAGANGGEPYCPNMAALGTTGINYTAASSSRPSDSFPGLTALISGSSPKTSGIYYDVAYDRSLDAPTVTTGSGLAAGPCTPFGVPTGTTTDNTEGIDYDGTKLNGGAPGATLTDGGFASIDPQKLVRDPAAGCAPVYPYNFIRVNTVFGVVHAAGGYTAWSDKRPSYAFTAGPGGTGLNDFYGPEVASTVVALPGVKTAEGASCATIRDNSAAAAGQNWISSFENIQCFDQLRVNAVLNQIAGKTHTGAAAPVPNVFGMDFQAVFVGQALAETGVGTGGYKNSAAVPTPELVKEIKYVDTAIGDMVNGLKNAGLYDSTLIIISAKHGEGPIDPSLFVADGANSPATLLGSAIPASESPLTPGGIGATEDDVSVLWLKKGASVSSAVSLLEKNAVAIGLGEILHGPQLALQYGTAGDKPGEDPRTPDIIVTPNLGVTYIAPGGNIEDHGGFSHDDTNVMLLVANPAFTQQTVFDGRTTAQVAPTILLSLGLDPMLLDGVKAEGTQALSEVGTQLAK